MNNTFVYLFKTTDKTVEKIKEINLKTVFTPNDLIINNINIHRSDDINYPFKNNLTLNGTCLLEKIGLNNVEFEIRTKSKFVFIYTNHQVLKKESLDIIEKMFEVEKFVPDLEKEKNLIFNIAVEQELTFLKNGSILNNYDEFDDYTGECINEYDYELPDKYKEGKLDSSYKLYEADLSLSEVNIVDFYYYKSALNIRDNKYLSYILDVFERVMA